MKTFDNNSGDYIDTGKRIKNSSFLLKIKYNQNNSVQGSIQWLEKKKTVCFRSLMELILLLTEAASDSTGYRTWDGEEGVISEVQKQIYIPEL